MFYIFNVNLLIYNKICIMEEITQTIYRNG